MKKNIIFLLIISLLLLNGCSGSPEGNNGNSQSEEEKYLEIYEPVLSSYYNNIKTGYGQEETVPEGHTGLAEAFNAYENDNMTDVIGYAVTDLSGDDMPELVVGEVYDEDFNSGYNILYAIYTCAGNEPVLTAECFARNQFNNLGEGRFSYYGSAGAANTAFGTCAIKEDGTGFIWEDFYFTDYDKDSPDVINYYHNTTGEWNGDLSEKLDIEDEEFWMISDELSSGVVPFELEPFSTLSDMFEPEVSVAFEEDMDKEYSEDKAEIFTLEDGDNSVNIVFFAQEEITDFRLLSISLKDVTEDGTFIFDEEVIYEAKQFGKTVPYLLAATVFYGDTPSIGISYTDKDGKEKKYAVEISGFDGKLCLMEI